MRLASRILVVAAFAVGPAVVALLGCGVDTAGTLPGLPNEIPNIPGGGVGSVAAQGSTTSSSSSSSTSTSTSSSTGGTAAALSPCDCAAALVVAGSACATCTTDTQTGMCSSLFAACPGGCSASTTQCFTSCAGDATCINGCLTSGTSAAYLPLLLCECNACLGVCAEAPPLSCDITLDGGASG